MKKLITIVLGSLLMLGVLGCAKKNGDMPNVNTEKTVIQQENKNQNSVNDGNVSKGECMNGCEMMRNSNALNKGKSAGDMQINCNNICEAAQGIQNKDVRSCEKSEGMLKYRCYTEIAKTSKDARICEKISDETFLNVCYTAVAEETKNIALCDNIKGTMFRKGCIEGAKK